MKLKSNEPFWLLKNGIIQSYPSLQEDLDLDLLIVGGGITGSLIAHKCIKEGYLTALVDRREIAHGSTSATTSMLQYEIDVPLHKLIEQIGQEGAVASYRACHDSIDELQDLTKQIKSGCGFRKKKSLYFAAYKKDIRWLKKEFEARKQYGFKVRWLEREEISQEYQLLNTYGGILSDQAASIDAFRLTHDLLKYNHKKGLYIYDKTELRKVNYKTRGITAITEYGNTIRAKKIIYCNGYESTEIIKDNFVKLLSTYAMVGEQVKGKPSYLKDILVWNTALPYIYMRTTNDNRLLIGGGDEDFISAKKRDELLGHKIKKLKKQLNKVLPEHNFRTDFAWAGTFGETKDGLPYIGPHPNFLNTYFVLGFGGNGITFSVLGMEVIAAMLRGERHELAPYFKFRR